MRYELDLVVQLCAEVGLECLLQPDEVRVELEHGVLLFRNLPDSDDCLIGFDGFAWHTHGGLLCSDGHGNCTELSYLDIIVGLAEGTVLVCERWNAGDLADRWLVHRDYVDEFEFLAVGEEIRIRRIGTRSCQDPL